MARFHRAAGPELLAQCRALGGCEPGEAKITSSYRLSARSIIHTVGPIWRGGERREAQTLANCYRNSLQLAVENEMKTIAFPAISCGAYGYPIEQAAHIALKTTREFLATNNTIEKVIFVLWGEAIYDASPITVAALYECRQEFSPLGRLCVAPFCHVERSACQAVALCEGLERSVVFAFRVPPDQMTKAFSLRSE